MSLDDKLTLICIILCIQLALNIADFIERFKIWMSRDE